MANAHETHGSATTGETDADVVRMIREQTAPVRALPAEVVSEALQKLDALAANGPPAPEDIAAVIMEAMK